jgi:hypothetical protein
MMDVCKILENRKTVNDIIFTAPPDDEALKDIEHYQSQSFDGNNLWQQFKDAEVTSITTEEWSKLIPADSYWLSSSPFTRDQLDRLGFLFTQKELEPLISRIKQEKIFHSPIIAYDGDCDTWIVISGKTRLIICSIMGYMPQVVKLTLETNNDNYEIFD